LQLRPFNPFRAYWHAGPVTVRPPLARAASAVLVLGSTLLGAVGAGVAAPTPTPTFDWPLDCPATVVQRYTSPNLDIEVSYEVVIDEATIPEVIAVEFGPATVDEFSGDGAAGVSAEHFPAWFGHNLDALVDALRDVTFEPGTVLVWSGAATFATNDRQQYQKVVAVLRSRAAASNPARFLTLLR
jgi:Barstar (barnase inhibitor)